MHDNSNSGLLSVLIPNHNYADFIGEAVASVAGQDYGAIELVVVDDASSDSSVREIEKAFAKADNLRRTELIALPRNRGKLGAINAALDELRGDYMITLDADDWLVPNYASRCIQELRGRRRRDPSLGFVYTDCNLMDVNGTIIDRGRSTAFDADLVDELSYLPEPAVMLNRAFLEVAPFDESIRVGTKHHKWKRVVANGWIGHHLAEPLFYYRMHDQNLSGIGQRVNAELGDGTRGERILSGYWATANA